MRLTELRDILIVAGWYFVLPCLLGRLIARGLDAYTATLPERAEHGIDCPCEDCTEHSEECDCYECFAEHEAARDREFDEQCALGYR